MHPVLLADPLTIYSFGVFTILAYLTGATVTYLVARRRGLRLSYFPDWFLILVVTSLAGAHLWHLKFDGKPLDSWTDVITLSGGALALGGGLLLGAAALLWLLRRTKQPLGDWCDAAVVGLLAGLVVGELGSLLGGVKLGTGSALPWAVINHDATGVAITLPSHPVAAYFALGYAALGGGLWYYTRRHSLRPGWLTGAVLAGIGVIQVIGEVFHDPRNALLIGPVRVSVLTGICLLLIGVVVMRQASGGHRGAA